MMEFDVRVDAPREPVRQADCIGSVPGERISSGEKRFSRRDFCVIVHDVAPCFSREIGLLLEQLGPEAGGALAGAVVPCWRGVPPTPDERPLLRRWINAFGDTLLHGWTHQRVGRPGFVSLLTNRADELGGLTSGQAAARIRNGLSLLNDLAGRPIRGFVPPAWQLPGGVSTLRESGLAYSVGFRQLILSHGPTTSLATWSWDWGRLPGVSRIGAALGSCVRRVDRSATPVIVLHPADVVRGFVPDAVRMIRRLKAEGCWPVRIESLACGRLLESATT